MERVSNSKFQGSALKVNPSLADLQRYKVPDSRYVPLSLRECANLETTLRSTLESQSFVMWMVSAIMRLLNDAGNLPNNDPIFDQLLKSLNKSLINVTTMLTSSVAFTSLKRRELLLSQVVFSVTEAQKKILMSDSLFEADSLFNPASIEAARSSARDVSLFKPHFHNRHSSSNRNNQNRPSFSSAHSKPSYRSPLSSGFNSAPQPQKSSSRPKTDQRSFKKSSEFHHKRGGFRK